MHDASNELSSSRFAAGMQRSGNFTWKVHLDARHEGYRLALKVDPASDDPEAVGADLAEQVLQSLQRIGLIERWSAIAGARRPPAAAAARGPASARSAPAPT